MPRVEQEIEVEVPVRAAYGQWTQFEMFPSFMDSVREIKQIDDKRLHWTVDVAGREEEFEAEITEQIPDARIAWKSVSGPRHAGAVDFHRLAERRTQVRVTMDVAGMGAAGAAAKVGDTLGLLERQVKGDLQRFKRLIEDNGAEPTGAWRGEIRPAGSGEQMTTMDKVATGLITVGAVNWGLVGLARFDLVGRPFARGTFGSTSALSRAVYVAVGAAGAYSVLRFAQLGRRQRAH